MNRNDTSYSGRVKISTAFRCSRFIIWEPTQEVSLLYDIITTPYTFFILTLLHVSLFYVCNFQSIHRRLHAAVTSFPDLTEIWYPRVVSTAALMKSIHHQETSWKPCLTSNIKKKAWIRNVSRYNPRLNLRFVYGLWCARSFFCSARDMTVLFNQSRPEPRLYEFKLPYYKTPHVLY